jgi:hypothetical protein
MDRQTVEDRPCLSCGSPRRIKFGSEICLHFPGGLESLNKPLVLMYPQAVVCLDCGTAQFTVPDAELRVIQENLGKVGVKAAS